jgi:hypothetical protein
MIADYFYCHSSIHHMGIMTVGRKTLQLKFGDANGVTVLNGEGKELIKHHNQSAAR